MVCLLHGGLHAANRKRVNRAIRPLVDLSANPIAAPPFPSSIQTRPTNMIGSDFLLAAKFEVGTLSPALPD